MTARGVYFCKVYALCPPFNLKFQNTRLQGETLKAVVMLNSEKMPVWFGGLRQVQGRWVGCAQKPCAHPVMATATSTLPKNGAHTLAWGAEGLQGRP